MMANTGDLEINRSVSEWQAWVVCLLASLLFLFEFFQLSSFDALNQSIQVYFHLNASQISMMSSAFLWGNVVCLLPAGFLLDRYGPRRCILTVLLISIFGLITFAFFDHYLWAIFGRFCSGAANAFSFISLIVLVSHWFPANRRAFVMGVVVNMAFLGGMLAHTPLVWLLHLMGWKYAMLLNVGVGFLIFAGIYMGVRDYPMAIQLPKLELEQLNFAAVIKKIMTIQNIGAGIFTACLNLPILVLCALWGIQYLQNVHHLSSYEASQVVSMIFLGSMLGSPTVGWISDRCGRRKPLMFSGAIISLLLCLPVSLFSWQLSVSALVYLFFFLGFFSATQVLGYPVISESNAPQYVGRACSLASMIIMGGGMLGQIVFGLILTAHGRMDAQAYRAAMLLFPLSIFFAVLLLCWMKETYGQMMDKEM